MRNIKVNISVGFSETEECVTAKSYRSKFLPPFGTSEFRQPSSTEKLNIRLNFLTFFNSTLRFLTQLYLFSPIFKALSADILLKDFCGSVTRRIALRL